VFDLCANQAVEFLNNLKAERSGKRVDTEVLDENASGMSESVRRSHYSAFLSVNTDSQSIT